MAKTSTAQIPKELLEQIYEEVEARVEAKFKHRIESLEKQVESLKREAATAREQAQAWRLKYFREKEVSDGLRGELSLAHKEIRELKETIEKQNARIAGLEKQLYGRKTEARVQKKEVELPEKKQRGKQPGAKGHGRKNRTNLPIEEVVHDFLESERICDCCGSPYQDIGSRSREEIVVTFRVERKIHIQKSIRKTCNCPKTPTVKTASAPPQLFAGGMFSTEFWQYVIFDKYHLQRPINRTRMFLESHGLDVSQGTITNGLKRLHDRQVFKPLVEGIRERISMANHLAMDETGWKIFQEIEGKEGYQHWLWVKLASDCCLFTIDQSRSRKAAKRDLSGEPIVVTSDMLKAYWNLGENVTNSWCWAHVRRYILKLQNHPSLRKSAKEWLDRIDWIYHCNNQRLAAATEDEFQLHDRNLRQAIAEFESLSRRCSKRSKNEEARKAFSMIVRHWKGLSLFVELPSIPMDNNDSERALRNPVVGRKNYYGSGACWSGEFAADLFSIFATLEMNNINCRTWLLEYLNAVAMNGGQAPEDACSFLPWNSPPLESLHS